ncbi:MAG: hypothetical protein P4L16_08085 [Chlamydiales bacterium]|nr:hypothetical protein [Chlamydiales bacterium]
MSIPVHYHSEVEFHNLVNDLALYGTKGHESLKIVHTARGATLVTTGYIGWFRELWNVLFTGNSRIADLAIKLFEKNKQFARPSENFEKASDKLSAFVDDASGRTWGYRLVAVKQAVQYEEIKSLDARIRKIAPYQSSLPPSITGTEFSKMTPEQIKACLSIRKQTLENVCNANCVATIQASDGSILVNPKLLEGVEGLSKAAVHATKKTVENFINYLKDSDFLYSLNDKEELQDFLSLVRETKYHPLEAACAERFELAEIKLYGPRHVPRGDKQIEIRSSTGIVRFPLRLFIALTDTKEEDAENIFRELGEQFSEEAISRFAEYLLDDRKVNLNTISRESLKELSKLADKVKCSSLQSLLSDILANKLHSRIKEVIEILCDKTLDVKSTLVQVAAKRVLQTDLHEVKGFTDIPEERMAEVIKNIAYNSYVYWSPSYIGDHFINCFGILEFLRPWFSAKGGTLNAFNDSTSIKGVIANLRRLEEGFPNIVDAIVSKPGFFWSWEAVSEDDAKFLLSHGINLAELFWSGICAQNQNIIDLVKQRAPDEDFLNSQPNYRHQSVRNLNMFLTILTGCPTHEKKLECVRFLLNNGVVPKAEELRQLMYLAIEDANENKDLTMLKLILSDDGKKLPQVKGLSYAVLYQAIKIQNIDIIRFFLENRIIDVAKIQASHQRSNEGSPLVTAAEVGNHEIITLLMKFIEKPEPPSYPNPPSYNEASGLPPPYPKLSTPKDDENLTSPPPPYHSEHTTPGEG